MRIQSNISAYNTYRNMGINSNNKTKAVEKLSSGLRINRAADDAAGLTISEKFRAQIRGMTQASANVQDGISLLDVADGALQECHSILQRMRELAVAAANDTNEIEDREALNKEYQQLKLALDSVVNTTTFNGIKLLDGSIGKLRLASIERHMTGLKFYGSTAKNTVANGINTSTANNSPPTKTTPSLSVSMPAVTTAITAQSGTVSTNGESLNNVYNLGNDPQYADLQGRTSDGLSVMAAGGDLIVNNNGYTGYVYSNSTPANSNFEVENNSGFVYSNASDTTIGSNDHTGHVVINSAATAVAAIGNNVGGEIKVGTIKELTITNNQNLSANKDDYTYYRIYHHTDGSTSRYPSSGSYPVTDDRVDTSENPQFDNSSGFSDGIDETTLQSDGVTYVEEYSTSGSYNNKPVYKVTYYYTLTNPNGYSGPKSGETAYNYAYNTYWDEYQDGRIESDAIKNTVGNNNGYVYLTNKTTTSVSSITYNSGTIYTDNYDVDVINNYGHIYATSETNNATFDLTGTNGSNGYLYIWSDKAKVNKNSGYINAADTVTTLTVVENSGNGYSYPTNQNPGIDGQSTVTNHNSLGLKSFAANTAITKNSGSAAVYAGNLTVEANSGYLYVGKDTTILSIGANTGTIVLEPGAKIGAWKDTGIVNSGTIELQGDTDPPLELSGNSGNVKVLGGASVSITNNTGNMEIAGGRLGGTVGNVTIANNSGAIRNGGELTLTGTNTGVIDNYGIVTGAALATSTTIRHHATDINIDDVKFPLTDADVASMTEDEIKAALSRHEYPIKFKANGQDFTIYAKWELTAYTSLDPDNITSGDNSFAGSFTLTFDLTDPALVSDEGLTPANFDGGYVVLGESSDMSNGQLQYSLGNTLKVNGENGTVGRSITFSLGTSAKYSKIYEERNGLIIQSGANSGSANRTHIYIERLSTEGLGGDNSDPNSLDYGITNLMSHTSAQTAINACSRTINDISRIRSYIGAMHNGMIASMNRLNIGTENMQAAENRIRDADMAKEVMRLATTNIISQASTAMLAQANQSPQRVLSLLHG